MSKIRSLNIARDAPALHQVFGDEESCRYLPRPAQKSVTDTAQLIKGWYDQCPETEWALIDEADGPCLGRITLIPSGDGVFEAGCVVIPSARGRGLARQGLGEAIDWVFERKNARRIFADIDPDNIASIKTFEKLGFRREGLHRATLETHIGVRDSVIMGLINTDPRPWRLEVGA